MYGLGHGLGLSKPTILPTQLLAGVWQNKLLTNYFVVKLFLQGQSQIDELRQFILKTSGQTNRQTNRQTDRPSY